MATVPHRNKRTKSYSDLHIGQEAIGGLSAGILGNIIGYPLDLVKTRMQTSGGSHSINTNMSILGVAGNIVRTEGITALYKGVAPPLISLSLLNTINFTQYCYFREFWGGTNGWDVRNGLAGLSGSPITSSISTVENLVKTQMQLDNVTSKRFKSSWDCVLSLTKSHGMPVLYTGHVINTAREGIFLGTYFYCYEGLRETIITSNMVPPQVAIPVAGGFAGAISWFVSFPLDCIRAGVQGQYLNGIHIRSRTVFQNLIQTRGILGLYSGVKPSIVRAFLVSGSRFSAYEGALWLLRGGRNVGDWRK